MPKEKGIQKAQEPGKCLSATTVGGGGVEVHDYGAISFLSNTAARPVEVVYLGLRFVLGSSTVAIVDKKTHKVVYNTGDAIDPVQQDPEEVGSAHTSWEVFQERLGYGAESRMSDGFLEQVNLTNNDYDYLWYKAAVPKSTEASEVVVTTSESSIAYVTVENGELAILSAAMGFKNGGMNPKDRKGIVEVLVHGKQATGPWNHSWILEGEEKQVFTKEGAPKVHWDPYTLKVAASPRLWLKGFFDLPSTASGHGDVSYGLDLSSMWKGVAYVNGFHIGRYWLVAGQCSGTCAPPVKNGHCYMHWKDCGKPTQTIYHIPTAVLQPKGNLVVLFEEGIPESKRDPSAIRLLALTAQQSLNYAMWI